MHCVATDSIGSTETINRRRLIVVPVVRVTRDAFAMNGTSPNGVNDTS